MSKTWTTEIDSDIGTLEVKVQYYLDAGSFGDHYSPPSPPRVEIQDIDITLLKPDHVVLDHLEEEILEEEFNYDPDHNRD